MQQEGSSKEIETVLFVPHTPGGELARLLQEEDDKFTRGEEKGRIKILERRGRGGTTNLRLDRRNI